MGLRKVSPGIKADVHFPGCGIVTRQLHQIKKIEKVLKKLKIRPEFYNIPALYKVENENNGLINNNQERKFCHE